MTETALKHRGPPPILLIVDDEPEILIALEDLFEADYQVLTASSGRGALALIAQGHDVAVILSDQRMPEMPGNVFLAEARKVTGAEAVLLTGYADLSAVISAVNDGAISGYAHKPWEPSALCTMIAAAAERHRLRRGLAFEQAVFAGLSERSADAICVVDRAGRIVRSNRRPFQGPVGEADVQALVDGILCESEERREEAEGIRWIRTRRIPFVAEGSGPHLLRIESDETVRRQAEQMLHQSEKLRALGTLAGGIAHDFNNLLAAVLGNLELATRSATAVAPRPDRLARFLDNAIQAARRGTALTQRLLSFSRQRDLAAETFDPRQAMLGIEDLVVRSMAGKVRLRYAVAPDIWPVHADRGQFELALVNLCINARDATPNGGEILLSADNVGADGPLPLMLEPGEHVRIAVTDRGVGMSDEVRARVYEPFFTTKQPGEGTGLGLPMVLAMTQAARGATTIDSVVGEGTTVALWLPRAEGAVPVASVGAVAHSEPGGLRILMAEDDGAVRSVVTEYLHDLGHHVVSVESGACALAQLEAGAPFDLLMTDYAMPGMSGIELVEQARRERPGIAVLLVTGFAAIEAQPADVAVVTKPFTRAMLQQTIAATVARMPQTASDGTAGAA